jgi:hypothetical protein
MKVHTRCVIVLRAYTCYCIQRETVCSGQLLYSTYYTIQTETCRPIIYIYICKLGLYVTLYVVLDGFCCYLTV